MNVKTTAILLLVFVLGVGALLLTRNSGTNGGGPHPSGIRDDEDQPIIAPEWLGDTLTQLHIDTEGRGDDGGGFALTRQRGRWTITHPNTFPAKRGPVDELLTTLANLPGQAIERAVERAGLPGRRPHVERRRLKLAMPEKALNVTQVRAALDEVRGEAVPE